MLRRFAWWRFLQSSLGHYFWWWLIIMIVGLGILLAPSPFASHFR